MKRKEFLHQLGLLSGGFAFGLNGMPAKAFAYNPFAINMEGTNGKILVIVQLGGGNDGLNTVVPYESDVYQTKRPDIALKKDQVLPLMPGLGLNPGLEALYDLYDNGKMSVIQSVGYEKHSRSHFRSTDIWLTGTDYNIYNDEGWVGKYLTKMFPSFPVQVPSEPMAIQLGSVESMLLQTDVGSTGIVFNDVNSFYSLVQGSSADIEDVPNTVAGEELKFMMRVASQSVKYADIIKKKSDIGKNQVTYTGPMSGIGNLSRQLAVVGKLISGGLQTPVYLTTIGGFDTHANQVVTGSTHTGYHTNLLKQVADAIASFQRDLEIQGLADKVTIMTFSEFGRRVNQNGTMGTDHGAAAPMFVVGNTVRGGVLGSVPNLSVLDTSGDVTHQFDYRQIYASVLQDHLGVDSKVTRSILGDKDFSTLPIFKASTSPLLTSNPDFELGVNEPNPFMNLTKIRVMLNKATNVKLAIYDMTGRELEVLREGAMDAGRYTIMVDGSRWAAGHYLCALKTDMGMKVNRMVKV
jgi:uncharacterized protein (DUF1501 family)